jgi:hypothetical protein
MDYSKKTELRIMSHNIWCGPVYNRDLHMRDIYMRYLPDVLGNSTFGNKALVTDLFKKLTNTNDTRVGLTVKQTETNTLDISASAAIINLVGLFLYVVIVPIAVLAAGLVIFLRRRHL